MTRFEISHLSTSKLVELRNTDSPRHEFYVHQALVEEFCHPLCDELREYWKEFDGETVGRFAQYLYQADCSFPVPLPVETTTPAGTSSDGCSPPPGGPGDTTPGASDDISELSSKSPTVWRPLTPLENFEIPKHHTPPKCSSPVRMGSPAGHDYEAVLLAYAKLYIISYGQGIYALSDLCISRLHRQLLEIPSLRNDTRVVENVIQLLRYVYRTPCKELIPPDPLLPAWAGLQDLASQFCALNIDVIVGNQGFRELLQEGGALATELVAKIVRRLGPAEAALVEANKAAATAETPLAEAAKPTTPGPEDKPPPSTFWGAGASSGVFSSSPAASDRSPWLYQSPEVKPQPSLDVFETSISRAGSPSPPSGALTSSAGLEELPKMKQLKKRRKALRELKSHFPDVGT